MSNDDTTNKTVEVGKAGPLFDDFLKEQDTYEATSEVAIKRELRRVCQVLTASRVRTVGQSLRNQGCMG